MKGVDEFKQYIKSYIQDTYKYYLSDEEISSCASVIVEKVRERSSGGSSSPGNRRVFMDESEVNEMIEAYIGKVSNKIKADGFELAESFDWVIEDRKSVV